MSDLAISLEGINRAESQIDLTARRLARLPSDATASPHSSEDSVSLSSNVVSLIQNSRVAEANMKALQSTSELQQRLINILG